MLKPISQPFCCGALNACFELQMHLLKWLCDPTTTAADVTQINLVPPRVPTQIEADWLWHFLYGRKQTRLEQAKIIAGMLAPEKTALLGWSNSVAAVSAQFLPTPPAWPTAPLVIAAPAWAAFKGLMEAFYERGLKSGLPYLANGTPAAVNGVSYKSFVQAFCDAHRSHPDALDLCVLCGGELGDTPEVDHWISKGQYPLLSVCQNNLVPICHDCNSSANKGEKPVHVSGCFDDWFHPYLRSGDGKLTVDYRLTTRSVTCAAVNPTDEARVGNLDELLNLSSRWTKRFKAEYLIQQDYLRRIAKNKIESQQGAVSQVEIQNHLQGERSKLSPARPWFEVHYALFTALLQQARLDAWQTELGLAI